MKKFFLRILLLFICIELLLPLSGCVAKERRRQSQTNLDYFDTVLQLVGYDDADEFAQTADAVFEIFAEYHRLCDLYHPYEGVNNLYTINQNAGKSPVLVDQKLFDLIAFSKQLGERTGGAFDITLGSVLSVWHEARTAGNNAPEDAILPDQKRLQDAARHSGAEKLILNEEALTVFLTDPEMSLDLGGVAKGYAVERAAEYLAANDKTGYMINAGGNVRTIGKKPNGENWSVGIQNPDMDESDPYAALVLLDDASLATSGDYQRYYTVNGVRYHHIIDPKTLMPSEEYRSVSVLCPDSGLADCLSTALFNLTIEEGTALLQTFEGVEALWILNDDRIQMTSGFEDYLQTSLQ